MLRSINSHYQTKHNFPICSQVMSSDLRTNTSVRNQRTRPTATPPSRATTGRFPDPQERPIPPGLPQSHLSSRHPTSALCRPCKPPLTSPSVRISSPWWSSLTKVSRTSSPWLPWWLSYFLATPCTPAPMACTSRGCPWLRLESFPRLPLIWAGLSHLVPTWLMGLHCRDMFQGPPSQVLRCQPVPPQRSTRFTPLGLGKILMQHSPQRSSPALAPAHPSSWTYSRRSWPNPPNPWTAPVLRVCTSTTPERWDRTLFGSWNTLCSDMI